MVEEIKNFKFKQYHSVRNCNKLNNNLIIIKVLMQLMPIACCVLSANVDRQSCKKIFF